MAGRPLRRARLALAAQQEALRIRGGEEPLQPAQLGYEALTHPEPVRHIPIPRADRKPRAPRPHPAAVPQAPLPVAAGAPPLTATEAATFTEAREIAIRKMRDFIAQDIDEYHPDATKLKLKQFEVMQTVLMLGGRIDPAALRGQATDEVGEMLAALKGGAAASGT